MHNDSGDSPSVYLLDDKGNLRCQFDVDGVRHIDFEDMATFSAKSKSYLLIADVGDNLRRRKELALHVLPEPTRLPQKKTGLLKPVTTITFQYEDKKKRDCEAVAVLGDTILVCSKLRGTEMFSNKSAELFAIEYDLQAAMQTRVAKKVCDVAGGMVTAMDVSPDQKYVVLRNYLYADMYDVRSNDLKGTFRPASRKKINLPVQQQGEAICFTADSHLILVTSEGKNQDIWSVQFDAR